jgi:hypothetical protein
MHEEDTEATWQSHSASTGHKYFPRYLHCALVPVSFRISYLKVISESARELLLPILAGGSREDRIEVSCVLVFY